MNPNRQSPTYCALAFNGYNQQTQNVCCMIESGEEYADFNQLMQSNTITKVQAAMNAGQKPRVCNRCWEDEEIGIESHRIKQTAHQYELDAPANKLVYLTLHTGNVCNFACRTCYSGLSFQWTREEQWIQDQSGEFQTRKPKTRSDYSEIIQQDLSNVRYIGVLGGEPFLDEDHFDVIDKINQTGHTAENCQIHYSTNGSVRLTDFYNKYLKNFGKVSISFSIDAVGPAFEYVRTQGKWDMVHNIIQEMQALSKQHENLNIHFHSTASPLNIMALADLSSYAQKHNINAIVQIVDRPVHYSFNIFPDLARDYLLKQDYGHFDEVIKNGLHKSKYDPDALEAFHKHLRYTEDYRDMAFLDYVPQAREMMELL